MTGTPSLHPSPTQFSPTLRARAADILNAHIEAIRLTLGDDDTGIPLAAIRHTGRIEGIRYVCDLLDIDLGDDQ